MSTGSCLCKAIKIRIWGSPKAAVSLSHTTASKSFIVLTWRKGFMSLYWLPQNIGKRIWIQLDHCISWCWCHGRAEEIFNDCQKWERRYQLLLWCLWCDTVEGWTGQSGAHVSKSWHLGRCEDSELCEPSRGDIRHTTSPLARSSAWSCTERGDELNVTRCVEFGFNFFGELNSRSRQFKLAHFYRSSRWIADFTLPAFSW